MNNPSPLIPQGTVPTRSRSHVRIAVFSILAVHLLLLGVLLLQGCKRTATEVDTGLDATTNENAIGTWVEPTNPTPSTSLSPAIVPLDTGRDFAGAAAEPTSTPAPAATPAIPTTLPGHIYTSSTPVAPRTESAPAPIPATGATHVVVTGDSFYVLAKRYQTSSRAIAEANPGIDSTRLRPGQKLNIPAPTVKAAPAAPANVPSGAPVAGRFYEVKSGDNLTRIANKHNTTVARLRSANKLSTDRIKVGQKLIIPAGEAPAARESVPGIDSTAPAPRFD